MSDQFMLDSSPEPTPRLSMDPAGGGRQQRPASYGYGYGVQDNILNATDTDPLSYLKVLHKRRWTAITAFLLVVGVVGVSTFTATPLYEAKTRVLIESDEKNVVSFKEVIDESPGNNDFFQTQYNILLSRAMARKTLDALQLWNTPPFGGAVEQKFSLKRAVLGAPAKAVSTVAGWFSSSEKIQASAVPEADETRAQSRAIDVFLSGLVVTPVRNARLVDITYRSPDPVLATTLVNTMAKTYIEQNLEYKFLASKEASGWLGERLTEQRREVEKAELALQRYRETNDAVASEDRQNIITQKLADLSGAVTRAKMERISKEGAYNQLKEQQDNPAALDSFPAIMSNPYIQNQRTELATLNSQAAQLAEKFGPKHPQLITVQTQIKNAQAKLQAEILKVVQSVRNEYQAALAQENSLTAALNQQKAEAQAMNRKSIEYGALEREVQSTKNVYDSLLQRAKETGVSTELRTSNIRILDPAEQPRRPSSPKTAQNMMFAVTGGLFLGIALAFLFEFLDNRIKRPNEIKMHLGIPALGFLPLLSKKVSNDKYPLLSSGVAAGFSEAFRAIRTNVVFSSAEEGSRSIVVTSTSPGEGKTLVATNLAVSLAQSSLRVLLIDGDMRKPKVHDVFGMKQEPGLSNLMVGNVKASEAVRKSDIPGLWLLTGGRNPPNPAELLGSPRFREFLASVSEHFDWIVIDSPPVMAVTDASVIAHVASGVLFVVRAEMTSRHAAQTALDQLDASRAKFYGGVLNAIDLEHNGYYYSQYYKREYGAYYASATQ